jgi:glycine dehydrogenase subunit 1
MARRLTRRDEIVVSGCVHPEYRATIETYLSGTQQDDYHEVVEGDDGTANVAAITATLSEKTAAVVVGYPSFFGGLPDLPRVAQACHDKGALLVAVNTEPYALAVCQPPGALGADIAVGEGQPIACPPQFGGPGVGLFACRGDRKYLQQLPGRVCGKTVDKNGEPGFVLTLATREQHIRRERATSNICTNQGLIALALAIRASLLGKSGFVATAKHCLAKAHYLESKLLEIDGIERGHAPGKFFNEFTLRLTRSSARELAARLEGEGIIAGLDLGRVDAKLADRLLVAVTEKHDREDLDRYVEAVAKL